MPGPHPASMGDTDLWTSWCGADCGIAVLTVPPYAPVTGNGAIFVVGTVVGDAVISGAAVGVAVGGNGVGGTGVEVGASVAVGIGVSVGGIGVAVGRSRGSVDGVAVAVG